MSQHDYTIANQGFPATRADINNALSAIATNNSGTSAPSTQYAGQFWIDTTSSTWTLYIHDGADDIQFATIDTSANTVNFIDSELGDNSVTTAKIADGNVTSAKLSYPLTTFSSTGIDDNATSTAITIDSSERVGINTASPSARVNILESTVGTDPTSDSSNFIKLTNNDVSSNEVFGIGFSSLYGGTDYLGAFVQALGNYNSNFNVSLIFGTRGTSGDATERMRIDSSGHAIIPAGVTLGTSAGTYNAANTLDDYEEGTWTPTLIGSTTNPSPVYSRNHGNYTKIGNTVRVSGYISLTTGSTGGTGDLLISGLPFTTQLSPSNMRSYVGTIALYGVPYPTDVLSPIVFNDPAINNDFIILGLKDDAAWAGFDAATVASPDIYSFQMTYQTVQ